MGCNYTDTGRLSSDCPKYEYTCFTKCEHVNEVYALVGAPNIDPLLHNLAIEQVRLQEDFLEKWCSLALDICQVGALLGFPCVQCGQVAQKGFSPCATKKIECVDTYRTISECQSLCVSPCQKCIKAEVDFMATAEGETLYALIINAIKSSLVDSASLTNVDNFITQIWPAAKVVSYEGMVMYIYLGRTPTEFEASIINIIEKSLPLPIGTKVELVDIDA